MNSNIESLPSCQDVQKLFSETILAVDKEHSYLEFDELVEEWNRIKNSNSTSSENDLDKLRNILNFVSKYSVDTKSPFFISKLYSGSDSLSLLADMLISY